MPCIWVLAQALYWLIVASSEANGEEAETQAQTNRTSRIFSSFQVVRFPNEACVSGANMSGTCYTADECQTKGGQTGGVCASGYGVCCTFALSCGSKTSQNCSYFVSTQAPDAGSCSLSVCKCSNNICQLRLDFDSFSVSQPSTSTVTLSDLTYGVFFPQAIVGFPNLRASTSGQCLLDSFTVTNPGGNPPPVICGYNSGEHMYVDASDSCNDLVFQLGRDNVIGAGTLRSSRQWSIKITQYSCDYNNLSPAGCTQYFYGNGGVGTVRSYNFKGRPPPCGPEPEHMREAGAGKLQSTACCVYNIFRTDLIVAGYDCVEIPGAKRNTASLKPLFSRFCGRSAGLVTGSNTFGTSAPSPTKTVCSTQPPFVIKFISDHYEYANERKQRGIQISYKEDGAKCT